MDVVVSYKLTNVDGLHLTQKYHKYFATVPEYKCSHRKREFLKRDRCHIYNTVTELSSPKPNIESKYNFNSYNNKNNYQYFSDSELRKMPLDFENSSMKNSFSMSSLQPSSRVCLEQSSHGTNTTNVLPNRAYNSLTHNKLRKKNPEQESWRNSWGQDDHKDEFWTSFESNYQYLMNNNLIESCKEVKNDLNNSPSQDWTYNVFKQQFLDLDSWLNSIQKTININEDNLTVRNIRLNQIEEMKRKNYQRKSFVNQSTRLVTHYPEHKDEILDYVSQLNTKWDQVAHTMAPKRSISGDCSFNMRKDVLCELRCLSKWIQAMEKKIEPLNFHKKWSINELKQKAKEHEITQNEVESHRKTVLSVVKSCEKLTQSSCQNDTLNGIKRELPLKKAQHWERRWQNLYLKCLEWQCYIEDQINNLTVESSDDSGSESDDEQPASKHRRLNGHVQTQNTCLSIVNKSVDSDVGQIMDTGENTCSVLSERMSMPQDLEIRNELPVLDSKCGNSPKKLHSDVPLNDNFHNSLRTYETLAKMIPQEFSLYNKTDNSARNVGVYYFPHEDTDPEQDKNVVEECADDEPKSIEESSDDEWTYKNTVNNLMETDVVPGNEALNEVLMPVDSSENLRNLSKQVLHAVKLEPDSIQKLVDQADELVHTPKKTSRKKCSSMVTGAKVRYDEHVREWLRRCHQNGEYNSFNSVGDSCDASGEYTTEDDDPSERRSSCDQTMTIIGSSQDNGIDISPVTDEPKVVLRSKFGSKKSRPFSTSELTHLNCSKLTVMQWVSESALHKMLTPLKDTQGATVSSSTIEECTTQTLEGSGCSINSLRRRKLKHRRRSNMDRKGHSGSADSLSSLTYQETPTCRIYRSPVRLSANCLLKSDSFSEPMMRPRFSSVERAIVSDPANCMHNSTSGTETEDDPMNGKKRQIRKKMLTLPVFRLGPQHGTVTCHDNIALSATSAEEQLSSFSEHAWDDFQERYISEAYSEEPVDPDQVKKVTDFGEDYRNYIDSHSDCASSFTKRSYPIFGHSTLVPGDESSSLESDSDWKDVNNLLKRSYAQLCCSEQLFAKHTAKPCLFSETDLADVRKTCRENIHCFRVLLERIELDLPSINTHLKSNIKSMLDKWENFERKTDEQDKCFLQQNIMELRKQLLDVSMKISNMEFRIKDKHQLEKNVQNVKSELDYIEDKKKLISEYNVKAHRLLSDSKYGSSSLKDSINDLYCIYDETHQKIQQQLTSLREALLAWSEFDVHMHELKTVLREDHESMGEDIAFTIKNITKYLPAKHHDDLMKMNNNSVMTLNTDHVDNMSSFLMNTLNVEGSLSDSGISDSGSEQDLCEREKRLVLLKKFARKLESILAPGSEALRNISKKIDEVEFEIKELQQTCHTIIKTGYFEHEDQTAMKKDKLSKNNFQNDVKNIKKSGSGDPGSDPGKGRSIFWRVLRAALPFHMAIVVLLCVACLLEPNCCDAINNLNLSLTPQLRYISGPPPT